MNKIGAKFPNGKSLPQKGMKAQNKKGKVKHGIKIPKIPGQK